MIYELLPTLLWAFGPTALAVIVATFALKVFPDLLGKLLFKSVEYQSEARLVRLRDELARDTAGHVEHLKAELAREASLKVEAAKAELQGAYSTLRTSVDIISAGQSGLRTEMVAVAREMWKAIVRLRLEFGDLFTFYTILLPREIERIFSEGQPPQAAKMIERYHDEGKLSTRINEFVGTQVEEGRLFAGERLWLIFHSTRAFHLRLALITSQSLNRRQYQDWCSDKLIDYALRSVLAGDVVDAIKAAPVTGIQEAIGRFEAEFLREASRVMSGSRAFADSLSDVQATLRLEHQKVLAGELPQTVAKAQIQPETGKAGAE